MTTRWTPNDSAALDVEIRRERKITSDRRPPRPTNGRLPKPRQLSDGRWLAVIRRQGLQRKGTFTTRGEAQAFLARIDKENR